MKLCELNSTYCSYEDFRSRLLNYALTDEQMEEMCGKFYVRYKRGKRTIIKLVLCLRGNRKHIFMGLANNLCPAIHCDIRTSYSKKGIE